MILSVVSIAYNNLEGLKKTLSGFAEKKYGNEIEIIVVDGMSTDGTKDYLTHQDISNKWVSEKDKGIYNAMNKGLDMANGDYIWFLNSGDYLYDGNSLDELMQILKTGPDAVYGETMMVDPNGKHLGIRSVLSTRPLPAQLTWKSFKMGMNVSHQSFIVKRELACRYDESYRFVSDIDWMICTLKTCKKVVRMNKILSCFTLDGFSSKHRKASNQERFRVLKKHYGTVPNLISHAGIAIRKVFSKGKV